MLVMITGSVVCAGGDLLQRVDLWTPPRVSRPTARLAGKLEKVLVVLHWGSARNTLGCVIHVTGLVHRG